MGLDADTLNANILDDDTLNADTGAIARLLEHDERTNRRCHLAETARSY